MHWLKKYQEASLTLRKHTQNAKLSIAYYVCSNPQLCRVPSAFSATSCGKGATRPVRWPQNMTVPAVKVQFTKRTGRKEAKQSKAKQAKQATKQGRKEARKQASKEGSRQERKKERHIEHGGVSHVPAKKSKSLYTYLHFAIGFCKKPH